MAGTSVAGVASASTPPVGGAAAAVFETCRDEINLVARDSIRRCRQLNSDDVHAFLTNELAPIVNPIAAIDHNAAIAATHAGVEVGIALVARQLLGKAAKTQAITDLWRVVFPAIAIHLAAQPDLIRQLNRAVVQLERQSPVVAGTWVAQLSARSAELKTVDEVRVVGQVLAWTSGAPHYRHSAIDAADRLRPVLALAAVGAPPTEQWPTVRDRMRADRWFRPADLHRDAGAQPRFPLVARVGQFVGLGGVFERPPLVGLVGAALVAWVPRATRPRVWSVLADAFGSALVTTDASTPTSCIEFPDGFRCDEQRLVVGEQSIDLRARGSVTSAVRAGTTLAFTTQRSHQICMVQVQS